jgi:hypothetical protein
MNVLRRDDQSAEIMLDIHKLIDQFPFVVVVDERDGAGDLLALLPLLLHQLLAH